MRNLRLTLMPWLAIDLALVAAQYWAVSSPLIAEAVGPDAASSVKAAVVLLLQLVKVAPAAARLNDLGRPQGESALALVPLVNLGLFRQLLARTPTNEVRDKRIAAWSPEPGAFDALGSAARTLTNPLFFALVLASCAAVGGLQTSLLLMETEMGSAIIAMDPVTKGTAASVGWGVTGLLLLYTLLQFPKRARASRASWFPSLFLLPSLFATLAFWVDPKSVPPTILLANVITLSTTLAFRPLLVSLWNMAAESIHRTGTFDPAKVVSAATSRWLEIAGPHGAASIAVLIGLQVVLPGIHYALQYAFVNQAVIFEPAQPSLRRSAALTRGIRRKLGTVLIVWVYLSIIPTLIVAFATAGGVGISQFFVMMIGGMAADQLPGVVILTFTLSGLFAAAITEVAMLHLYLARRERLAAVPVTPSGAAAIAG